MYRKILPRCFSASTRQTFSLQRVLWNSLYPLLSIFAARRVCIVRTMPWQNVCPSVCPSVCLSVRLSHAGILSTRLHIFSKSFHHWVAPPFQLFHTKRDGSIPMRTPPPNGGVECRVYEKNHDFRPISRSIAQMMQDRVIVTIEGE